MHDSCMKFDYVRISHTHRKYWYQIRDVLVAILHALWGLGTNSSWHKIFEVRNLRFNTAHRFLTPVDATSLKPDLKRRLQLDTRDWWGV